MSARRIGAKHTLPPNPVWVDIPRTDGNAALLPTNTTKIVDSNGDVNFMRPVLIDESLCVHWRNVVGLKVAEALGLPSGPTYVLRAFPEGYHMYDHHKGPQHNPRHDPYLHGSKHVNRFRSVNEFIPHAVWLTTDPTMNRANCQCKYCAKRPQMAISQSLGLSQKRGSSSPAPTQRAPTQRTRKPPPTKPYVTARQPPKLAKPAPPVTAPAPTQPLATEKDNDIRDTITIREVQGIRHHRRGELVWCALPTPIQDGDVAIEFWPGLIDMVTTKGMAVPLNGSAPSSGGSAAANDPTNGESSKPSSSKTPEITWKPQQKRIYTTHLLATTHVHAFTDDDVLPYLAHTPSAQLVGRLQEELPGVMQTPVAEELSKVKGQASEFNPVSPTDSPAAGPSTDSPFRHAIAPYSLALQIAASLVRFWTPTDEWEFQAVTPEAANPGSAPTLQTLIDGTARPQPSTSEGTRTPATITQLRYQGLWWGAERIWTEELVRLKLNRSQFVPKGSELVFPPASPSRSTIEWTKERGATVEPGLLGPAEKGLFMRIDALFVVDVPNRDGEGSIKECRASGMLYELVDQDWREESASAPVEKAPKALSRPVLTQSYPLPDPPDGYKFHAILAPGNEVVLSLSLISGRYYPHLFRHPRLAAPIARGLSSAEALKDTKYLWALHGLVAGVYQSMDPEVWKPSRSVMFEEADIQARGDFKSNREGHIKAEQDADADGESVSVSHWHDGDSEMVDVFRPEPQSISASQAYAAGPSAGSSISAF